MEFTGFTAAAARGDLPAVKAFIENAGAAPDCDKNQYGNVPLHAAAAGNHVMIVQYLLQKKANATLQNNYGKTALDLAKLKGHHQCAQFIQEEQRKQQQASYDAVLGKTPSPAPKVQPPTQTPAPATALSPTTPATAPTPASAPPPSASASSTDPGAKLKVAAKVREHGVKSLSAEDIKIILSEAPDFHHIAAFMTYFDINGADIADCTDGNEFATYIPDAPPLHAKRCYRFLVDFVEKNSASGSAAAALAAAPVSATVKTESSESSDTSTSASKATALESPSVGPPPSKQPKLVTHAAAEPDQHLGSKITRELTTNEVSKVVKQIGLHKLEAIFKAEDISGQELLNYTQKELTDLLIEKGLRAPKARTMWQKLEPYLMPAEGRVDKHVVRALVIGMDDYGGALNPLKNSVKDAYAMAQKLESAGVIVTLVTNVTIDELKAERDKYMSTLKEGDVGLLFYAGHGKVFKNTQRIIAKPKGEEVDYDKDTLKVDWLLIQMSRKKTKANIVFLDCCREFKYEATNSRGGDSSSGEGNVISYACSPNHKASDGAEGDHGLYTKCLLKHILTPNIDVHEMLKRVNADVIAVSKGRGCKQTPYVNSSLYKKLCLFY